MEHLISLLHYLLSFFVILSVIVFIHEYGHYIVARWCGVKIDVFSIGFGKEFWGFTDKVGTRWKFSMIPLGGYVKMYGDSSEASTPSEALEQMSPEEKSKTFHHKKLWQKSLIVAAGPVANFLLTIFIFTYFLMANGLPSTEPIVGEIMKETPAQAAGLQKDDRVLTVNGTKVELFSDIPRLIITNVGTPVRLEIERGGEVLNLIITPKLIEEKDGLGNPYKRPVIGFKSKEIKYKDIGFFRAIGEAVRQTYQICAMTLKVLGQMVTGDRDAKEIKGPIGIAKLSGQATEKGIMTVLWFMAMLSANLGLVNLLPVPMLDGGHLLYYSAEALRGKPLAQKVQEFGFRIGMAMLAMLMAFAIFNDVRNLL
jgi:regulator of sigma E protease